MVSWLGIILIIYAIIGLVLHVTGYMDHSAQREQWEKDHPGMKWDDWQRYRK